MKHSAIRPLFLFAALMLQVLICAAQNPSPITQNPTYPCDTGSADGGTLQCIHVCAGDTVTYSTNMDGALIKWDIFGDGTIVSGQGTNQITVVWNSPGQYQIMLSVCQSASGGGCETFHLCVIVEPGVMAAIGFDPNYTIVSGCIKICNNTPVTFNSTGSVSNIVSCDWDFGDGFTTTTNGSIVTHTYTSPGNYTVVLTAHSSCCSDTAHACVTVDSLSGPDIFCISAVCGGTSGAQYCTSANCTGFNWTVTGGTISGASNTNCINVNWGAGPAGTVSLTTINCTPATCPIATVATVPIMPNGSFTIGGPTTACVFPPNTYLYSAPYIPGAQYTWTLTDPSLNTTTLPSSSPPYLQNIAFNTTGTYVLKCHMKNDVLECEGDGILTINVLGDFSVTGSDTVCALGTGTFSASQNFNPFNVDWTTSPSVGTVLNSNVATFTFNTPGTYTVIATPLAGTACSPFKTLTVVVVPAPAQPTISPNPLVCPGTPYTYTASGSGAGVTYNWTATGGITFANPSANPVTANIPVVFSSGTITVTPVSSTGCPGPSATINVNAYATPAPSITIGDPSVCPDETPTYTSTLSYPGNSTVVWSLSPAALGTIQSGQGTGSVVIEWHSSIPNMVQTCTVTVTETICGNLSGTSTYTVTIHPTPTPSAPDVNICIGGTASLTATGGGGSTFTWFSSNGNNVGTGNPITVNSPGNYYVEETDVNGCKAKDYLLVTAYPQPTVGISALSPASCDTNGNLTSNIQLQTFGGGGYTFAWSGPGIVGSTISNPITVSSTGTYSVVVTEPVHGCTKAASYTIFCTASDTCVLPVCTCAVGSPSSSQNGPYCDNYTFTTNSACPIITWSFGDGFFGSGPSVIHQYSAPGVYFVYYSAGDTGCCPNISTYLTITVPAIANFTAAVTCNTVCFTDASASLPSDPINPSLYSWDFGDTQTSTQINPCHTYTLPGTYTVTLEITTNSGCKAKIIKSVNVNGPNVSASIAATACNQPVNFNGTTISNNITSWVWDFGDGQGSNMQNAQHTYTVLVTTTFNVTLTVTDANGCTATVSGSITVNPPPPPFNLIYTSPGCGNVLLDAGGGYTSYQWFLNGTAINGATNQTYSATTAGNYSAQVTDANGCLIASNPASIFVNPLPPLNLTASPQPLCSNQNITLNSGLGGNYFVEWKDAGYNPLATGFTYTPGMLAAGSYTYHVTATDLTTTCKDSATITIVVGQAPSVTISNSNPAGICAPNPVTLTATGNPVSVNYLWSTGAATPVINVYSSGTYTVTVTDPANGCMASAFNNVIIFPLPDLSMLPIGCDSACDNPVADTIHGPPGMSMYEWQVNGVPVVTTQNIGLNPILLPLFGTPYTITLIATTVNGCVDSTKFEYTPLDCDSVSCYALEDTIWCNTDGTYSFQLKVQNNHGSASASILLDNFTLPFAVNGLTYYYQFLNVPSGGNSGWFPSTPLILSNPNNLPAPTTFCLHSLIVFGDTCCCDSLCIELPNCNPCDNISVSTASDSGSCCQIISITNNFNPNYFTGVQVIPITVGSSIASTSLGVGGTGWGASGNSSIMTFYPPLNGTIPLGTINNLFTLCLNLQIGTPNPQYVVFNWLVPDANGMDSVVCSDTLVFHCDPPLENPCGTINDSIVCNGDGSYSYSFTITNNSANPIQTAVIDYLNPISGVTMPIIFFYNPPIAPDDSATQTVIISSTLPAGSVICYHMTLLDSIGCCCHAIDTVCFTLPSCDTTCACGAWDLFTMNLTPTDITIPSTISNVECGANMPHVVDGSSVTFTAGGYHCTGDSTCTALLTWSIPGASPSSGTGLPSFTFNNPGAYTLKLYGSCGGHLCDSCFINFVVDTPCHCGSWNIFTAVVQQPPPNLPNEQYMECGANFSNLLAGTSINFTDGGYTCNGDASCTSSLTWSIPGGTPSAGTGLPSFTMNSAGTYTLTLYGYCGGNICDSCKITFTTVEACVCGSWQPFLISTSNVSYTGQACGGSYNSKKGFPISLSGSYSCVGNSCDATYTWTIYRNNVFFLSGTTLPITFTPTQTGTYKVVISANCDGHDCETCTFTFNVKTPPGPMAPYEGGTSVAAHNMLIKALPNPARDVVTLRFTSDSGDHGVIEWVNELGVSMKQTSISWKGNESEIEMNVSDLPSGIYYVRFTGENGSAITKVIVYR